MEKLELHEIVGYLPYGLKVVYNNGETKDIISTMIGIEDGNNILTENHVVSMNFAFKTILRPLSDLTKEIEVDGEKFVPFDELKSYSFELNKDKKWSKVVLEDMPYSEVLKLYSWHFDIHNLIDRKLAIDINTI